MVARFRSGDIAHESFSRIVERIAVTGDVGVVMGREVVRPAPDRLEGRERAGDRRPVLRRFTNVWLWRDGAWRWLARHASIRPELPRTEDLAQ